MKQIFTSILDQVKKRLKHLQYMAANPEDSHDMSQIKRFLDDQDRRHYQEKGEDVYSVTTVIDKLEEDQPKHGLRKWKEKNDGKNGSPYWKHILEYKQNRGTLAHHDALSEYTDSKQLWSGDETSSLNAVMDRTGDDRFLYSILADREWVSGEEQYEILRDNENFEIDDVLYNDLDYFSNQFQEIADQLGINQDTVEHVEEMFVVPPNHEHDGYGGQVDLIYRDPLTGGLVVADLKTSKRVYSKHKHQIAAYSKAVEKTGMCDEVERGEIIRINPDNEDSEVYEVEDFDQYWKKFADGTKKL